MILFYGTYSFGKTLVAYRNDACENCGGLHISELYRTFDMAHVFWVPVIPLGYRRQWLCTNCGEVPTGKQEVSTGLKTLVTFLLAIAFIGLMFVGPDQGFELAQLWGVRFAVLLLAVGIGVSIWQDRRRAELAATKRATTPFQDNTCRYCGGHLVDTPDCHCPNCSVKRY